MKHEQVIERMVQDLAEAHGDDPYAPGWMVALAFTGLFLYIFGTVAFWCYLWWKVAEA